MCSACPNPNSCQIGPIEPIGVAQTNISVGEAVTLNANGYVQPYTPNTNYWTTPIPYGSNWSNAASTPLQDIQNAMYKIRTTSYHDMSIIYCSCCSEEIGKGIVALHLCITEAYKSQYQGITPISQSCCCDIHFCNEACVNMWSLRNAEWLQVGKHGAGYRLDSLDQMKWLSAPANRKNPYVIPEKITP